MDSQIILLLLVFVWIIYKALFDHSSFNNYSDDDTHDYNDINHFDDFDTDFDDD